MYSGFREREHIDVFFPNPSLQAASFRMLDEVGVWAYLIFIVLNTDIYNLFLVQFLLFHPMTAIYFVIICLETCCS